MKQERIHSNYEAGQIAFALPEIPFAQSITDSASGEMCFAQSKTDSASYKEGFRLPEEGSAQALRAFPILKMVSADQEGLFVLM